MVRFSLSQAAATDGWAACVHADLGSVPARNGKRARRLVIPIRKQNA